MTSPSSTPSPLTHSGPRKTPGILDGFTNELACCLAVYCMLFVMGQPTSKLRPCPYQSDSATHPPSAGSDYRSPPGPGYQPGYQQPQSPPGPGYQSPAPSGYQPQYQAPQPPARNQAPIGNPEYKVKEQKFQNRTKPSFCSTILPNPGSATFDGPPVHSKGIEGGRVVTTETEGRNNKRPGRRI